MAEGIVSDLIVKAMEALGKAALKQAGSWWGARDDLKKLEKTMRFIKARLRDAEMRQEADGGAAIKEWLRRLKLVLYQADDLFDEVLTRDRQEKLMESIFDKVGFIFSTSSPFYQIPKLANDIKSIRKELDAIKSDISILDLRDLPAQELPIDRLIRQRETAPLNYYQETRFISRDLDQNNIIKMLFDPIYDSERVTIIPIVGFGGLGKTTLAQLVFNDERVRNHFDLTKWAYVPEKNDLILIKSKIYRSFTDKSYDGLSLDQIQRGIVDSVRSKKFLLVLDDVWDEDGDILVNLMDQLKCGNKGSKIIITTRSAVVASKVVGNQKLLSTPYKLGTLTNDQSWDLFKSVAFKEGQEYENTTFAKIGKEIVNMCGNVPLAIKVVGGYLQTQDTENEWLLARDAQHSKSQLTKDGDIMNVLKLSYDYLPPTLKQCFAYCSLFPKGCRFNRDDLVYMWMAQGYVEPSNHETGNLLYMNLLARGFFQDPEFSDDRNVVYYKMHDLLHDLAQLVAGEESRVLHDESSIPKSDWLLHVNINSCISEARSSLFAARRTRSFLSTANVDSKDLKEFISRMQHLRVLQVKLSDIIDKLPNGIGRLMHLRYLYIKSEIIEYLPDSITRLENLQTLDVQNCRELKELPRDFAKLANIRHLLLPKYNGWSELPRGFGKLTSLQVLNLFIVGENNGIDSLPVLKYKGTLVIKFWKWRRNSIQQVQTTNLKYCDKLAFLELWFEEDVVTPSIDEMNELLMNLQLPPNLIHLKVCDYKGDKFPSKWFSELVSISIEGRGNCTVDPYISCMNRLSHLRKVELLGLKEEKETVEGNSGRISREWQRLTSLRELKLEFTCKMKKLPAVITSLITSVTTLEHLYINGFENLIELPEENGNLSLLRLLHVSYCPKLKSLPTSLLSYTSLQYLEVIGCPHLERTYGYGMPGRKGFHLIQNIPHVAMGSDQMLFH